MTESKSTHITWHGGDVEPSDRHRLLGQRGATVWLTGLSGSGKSTVAVALESELMRLGRLSYRLDGDNVRHGLCANLGFSPDHRDENIRRIGEVAKLFADAGVICLCSFVSPYAQARDGVRQLHQQANLPFFEVYLDVPLAVAESRDPKGLYQQARAGEITGFTGIDSPFEPPAKPEAVVPTHEWPLSQSVGHLIEMLRRGKVLPPPGLAGG